TTTPLPFMTQPPCALSRSGVWPAIGRGLVDQPNFRISVENGIIWRGHRHLDAEDVRGLALEHAVLLRLGRLPAPGVHDPHADELDDGIGFTTRRRDPWVARW